jgi:hypothetical protein
MDQSGADCVSAPSRNRHSREGGNPGIQTPAPVITHHAKEQRHLLIDGGAFTGAWQEFEIIPDRIAPQHTHLLAKGAAD